MLELLERRGPAAADEDESRLAGAIDSIRHIGDANWKQLFASVSVVDQVLAADPAGAYAAMDDSSRDAYRHVVSYLARHGMASEREVAEAAVSPRRCCRRRARARTTTRRRCAACTSATTWSTRACRRSRRSSAFAPPLLHRVADVITTRPTAFYLGRRRRW